MSLEIFAEGSTVEYVDGKRTVRGSILTIDEDRGLLTVLDLTTKDVSNRRPSELTVVHAAPKPPKFRRRASQETQPSPPESEPVAVEGAPEPVVAAEPEPVAAAEPDAAPEAAPAPAQDDVAPLAADPAEPGPDER